MTYEAMRRQVAESRHNTQMAAAFRRAFGMPLAYAKAASRPKRVKKRERIDAKRLMANRWGAAERHGR